VTKGKLKREKIEMENNDMATSTTTAATTTVTPGNICVLCRREMSLHPPFTQNDGPNGK